MKKITLFIISFLISFVIFSQASFDIDKKLLPKETLEVICDNELKWLRNEIYARHGYVFSDPEVQSYFEAMHWYSRADNKDINLSDVEQQNIEKLKKEEDYRNKRSEAIKKYFKAIKNRTVDINSITGYEVNIEERYSFFSNVLNIIDIDQIHFCGSKGRYMASIDNGFSDISYFIEIDKDNIRLGYNSSGLSSIFPWKERVLIEDSDYPDYANPQLIEHESSIWLQFTIDDNNTINFEGISGAG